MEWHKLTPRTMPPVSNRKYFLLWLGANEDGGFPVLGKRAQYEGKWPYIRYVAPSGWRVLEDVRGVLWAKIEEPEQARKKREDWERRLEDCYRKEMKA